MYKHILIPTDGSALSRRTVKNGVKLAKALGARVTAFYAAPPATPLEFRGMLPVGFVSVQEHAQLIEKAAAKHLGAVEAAAKAAGVACAVLHRTSDFPAEAIVEVAKKRKCDLIFMSSHGQRGLSGMLLGSQTQKVLGHSGVPVLVDK